MIICSLFFISRCKTGDRRRYVFRLSLEHSWSAVCRRVGIAGHLRTQNRTFNDFCALYICSLGRIRRRAPERGLQCAIATGRGVSSGYSQTPGAVNIVCTRWDGESLRFFEFASTYSRFLALLTALSLLYHHHKNNNGAWCNELGLFRSSSGVSTSLRFPSLLACDQHLLLDLRLVGLIPGLYPCSDTASSPPTS